MWIVVRDWGMEVDINTFKNKEKALDFFKEWNEFTDAKMYLAKVDRTNKC